MKILNGLKAFSKKIKSEILTLYFVSKNPDIKRRLRYLLIFIVAYALSPVDLIPDFIPLIGYLDDLIILPVLIRFALSCVPEAILLSSRKEAEQSITLKKNWYVGSFFILIWIILLNFLLVKVLKVGS